MTQAKNFNPRRKSNYLHLNELFPTAVFIFLKYDCEIFKYSATRTESSNFQRIIIKLHELKMLVKVTYKEPVDRVGKMHVAMPGILVLRQSSCKFNGLKNIDDVVHPATIYAYKILSPKLHNV